MESCFHLAPPAAKFVIAEGMAEGQTVVPDSFPDVDIDVGTTLILQLSDMCRQYTIQLLILRRVLLLACESFPARQTRSVKLQDIRSPCIAKVRCPAR